MLLLIILVCWLCYHVKKTNLKARAYEEAEQRYHSQRKAALSGKDDKSPVNRGVGMEKASIIRQRLTAGETREALAVEYQIKASTVRYIEEHWISEDT